MKTVSKRHYRHFEAKPRFNSKLPRIYLDSESPDQDPHIVDIYLVNNSPMLIDWIKVDLGYVNPEENEYDDDNKFYLTYEIVLPGEAVLIASFDEAFHSDFLNQLMFSVKERGRERLDFNIVKKGIRGLQYRVLEWLIEVDKIDREVAAENELMVNKVVDIRKKLETFYESGAGIC